MAKQQLTIGWLYPDLMSTYGDHGNIITLEKRCQWRGIETKVLSLSVESNPKDLAKSDLVFMGGAQDRQQKIVSDDFRHGKAKVLAEMIEDNIPGLYICGAYQFLGNYYKEADGTIIKGLGILDVHTENPGLKIPRLIGNIVATTEFLDKNTTIIGFENHGGRTFLGDKVRPLACVSKGFGNNGKDGSEGAIYKNSLGSYMHGPILPKNPVIADWLIQRALEKKYDQSFKLDELDDTLEYKAHTAIARRLVRGI